MSAINRLAREHFFFWDYGNAFLLEAQRAGERGRRGSGTLASLQAWPARRCGQQDGPWHAFWGWPCRASASMGLGLSW